MRWTLKAIPEKERIEDLAKELTVEPLIAKLLLQRGITSFEAAKKFFRPQLNDLEDPYQMKGMKAAVARIEKAIAARENILVYGDYDVDGTTAVALVSSYLLSTYSQVATYIPDRYAEGYGVSYQGIDFADDNDIGLIIALDCGVKAIDQVAYAKKKGIDFIVCDHHRPGDQLPDAVAVLDPKQEDCNYPYKELCGCGVGFKLIQGLGMQRGETLEDWTPYLDLVAIAIGADIVPITGENRILAYYGLERINKTPRAGIKALIQQVKKEELTITDVVFMIAPRINAAGRMKHGQYAVDLLVAPDLKKALAQAEEIETFNLDRRGTDQRITEEALLQIKEKEEEERYTTVVYQEDWHKGVIGIVASRLIETYYRPTLVFTKSGAKLAASARSVKGFDVYKALEKCTDFLEQFGGHTYAAGLTMAENQYEGFKTHFEKIVTETIDPQLRTPELIVDSQISFDEITPKLLRILKQFAPFGPGNRAPTFMAENLKDVGYARTVGEDGKHLKCALVARGAARNIEGIGFNLGPKLSLVQNGGMLNAAFAIEENTWKGKTSLQLRLKDLKEYN